MSTDTRHPHATPHPAGSEAHTELSRRQDAATTKGTSKAGYPWQVSPAFDPQVKYWPNVESHLWGAFPVLAIETGGYNDIEAEDPFTGRTFYLGGSCNGEGVSPYDALRRLVDAMEEAGFLDEVSEPPVSRT